MRASRRTLGLQPELTPTESSSKDGSNRGDSESPQPSEAVPSDQEEGIVPSVESEEVNVNDTDASMSSEKSSNNDDSVVQVKR